MPKGINRRDFLKRSATGALGAGLAFSLPAIVPQRAFGASDRIRVGIIGAGGMNNAHVGWLLGRQDVEIVGVCDVDSERAQQTAARVSEDTPTYGDFRALLDRDDIDAVWIATPDHWHALTSIYACQAGKDVYCEKPLTLTIDEGKAMVKAARRYGRVFQTGSQQRSDWNFRYACELARNGYVGRLHTIHVGIGGGPTSTWQPDEPVPDNLDWDMWLGPAPEVPYNAQRCHYNFRWFYDYSGGKMTDWGAHHNDIGQWGHGMDGNGPVKIEGTGTFPTSGLYNTAVNFRVEYTYADGIKMICSDANRHGVVFEGTDGEVHVDRGFLESDPPEIIKTALKPDDVHLYESPGHHDDFLECMRTRERPICDVEVGHRSVTVCHLGNIAIRTGKTVEWDPVAERITNDESLNRWLSRPYRAPWVLPT
jgi:predicted dehydrogenase